MIIDFQSMVYAIYQEIQQVLTQEDQQKFVDELQLLVYKGRSKDEVNL